MMKTSDPAMKDGLGIVARLVIIAMLLGVLGTILQGCNGKSELETAVVKEVASASIIEICQLVETEGTSGFEKTAEKYHLSF